MQASPFFLASPPADRIYSYEYFTKYICITLSAHHIDDRMIDYIYMNILQIHSYQPEIVDFCHICI